MPIRAELELIDYADKQHKIVQSYLQGNNVNQIARQLGYTREHVSSALMEFKQFAASHEVMRARARETIVQVDHHYNELIKEAYSILEDAKIVASLTQRSNAVKLIADIETKRFTMMKDAGLLKYDDLMDRLVEAERNNELLIQIIREEVLSCPRCRSKVSNRLSEVTKQAEMVDLGII